MNCKLCLQSKVLRKSHIIPEFFYKPAYDRLNRINFLSTNAKDKNRYIQKGIRENLLCDECEELLSPWEKYVREVFYGGVEIGISHDNNKIEIYNLDYQKFKLFELSLLWRASVSKNRFFERVSLGPHEETIRQMIFRQQPDEPYKYGCIIFLMTLNNNIMDDLILQPDTLRIDGHRCIRFILGGCMWVFNVSSHSHTFGGKQFFLQRDGSIVIPKTAADNTELLKKFAYKLSSTGKLKNVKEFISSK
jgi:hypothetical protein